MKLVRAKERTLLLTEDGRIHAPFSLYLNMAFENPHTRASVTAGLHLLDLFIRAFSVNLEQRALDGQCLTEAEKQALRQMASVPRLGGLRLPGGPARPVGGSASAVSAESFQPTAESPHQQPKPLG